jgi:hypothetical protein
MKILVSKPKWRRPLEGFRVGWWVFRWILMNMVLGHWLVSAGSGYRPLTDLYECNTNTLVSIKCAECLYELSDYQLERKNSAPWSDQTIRTEVALETCIREELGLNF